MKNGRIRLKSIVLALVIIIGIFVTSFLTAANAAIYDGDFSDIEWYY